MFHGDRFLMITADDFGVNAYRSEGIIRAAKCGAVTHTSAIVNGEASAELIGKFISERSCSLRTCPPSPFICSMGLHFNLTEGDPISSEARQCHYLVDPLSGKFKGKASTFLMLSSMFTSDRSCYDTNAQAVLSAIESELKAQIDLFLSFVIQHDQHGDIDEIVGPKEKGIRRIWVDGHHHVHMLSPVFEVLMRHAEESFAVVVGGDAIIGGMRMPHQQGLTVAEHELSSLAGANQTVGFAGNLPKAFFKNETDCFGEIFWRKVSSLAAARSREVSLLERRVFFPDGFFGLDLMGSMCSKVGVLAALSAEKFSSVIEVMTHVGFAFKSSQNNVPEDSFFHDGFSKSLDREHELTIYEDLAGKLPEGVKAVNCVTLLAGSLRSLENLETQESKARKEIEDAESVSLNALLSVEVEAYLRNSRKHHSQNRTLAKAKAAAAVDTVLRLHQAECEERVGSIDSFVLTLMEEMRNTFKVAGNAIIQNDESA